MGYIGGIIATGPSTATTTLRGCQLDANPLASCTNTGSATIARDVHIELVLRRRDPRG